MIEYNYELVFKLDNESYYSDWIGRIIKCEGHELGDISYIFCNDDYLLNINKKYLDHDTYTDIVTFDYTDGLVVSGDVFISMDRVRANAEEFKVDFKEELKRVMAHGILHLLGYKDKTYFETKVMRKKEEEMMELFHVEH